VPKQCLLPVSFATTAITLPAHSPHLAFLSSASRIAAGTGNGSPMYENANPHNHAFPLVTVLVTVQARVKSRVKSRLPIYLHHH